MRYVFLIASAMFLLNLVCSSAQDCPEKCCDQPATECESGFVSLFNGKNFDGWQGALGAYEVENGVLSSRKGAHVNLFTKKEYSDFILRLEYKVPPCGNNGVGIRTTLEGAPSVYGIEIQILDDALANQRKLDPVQLNGSIYGVVAAETGHDKPVGEWNAMEIYADGPHIRVTLNDVVIVDADISQFGDVHYHGNDLVGLHNEKGHIALCGHNDPVSFRNIRIKELD